MKFKVIFFVYIISSLYYKYFVKQKDRKVSNFNLNLKIMGSKVEKKIIQRF